MYNSGTTNGCIVLGHVFPASHKNEFLQFVKSLPWMTYRSSFPLLGPHKSDSGWGCMIRSAQMLVATTCLMSKYGLHLLEWSNLQRRELKLSMNTKEMGVNPFPQHNQEDYFRYYADIISLFQDHPDAPFSIHKISTLGVQKGIPLGNWFGPNTISSVFSQLINELHNNTSPSYQCPITCYLLQDATLYYSEMKDYFDMQKPILLMIPIRLGVEGLNEIYFDHIKHIFNFPHCVGIAG